MILHLTLRYDHYDQETDEQWHKLIMFCTVSLPVLLCTIFIYQPDRTMRDWATREVSCITNILFKLFPFLQFYSGIFVPSLPGLFTFRLILFSEKEKLPVWNHSPRTLSTQRSSWPISPLTTNSRRLASSSTSREILTSLLNKLFTSDRELIIHPVSRCYLSI